MIGVYILIIFETVHRTLAAALGGLIAVIALNYFTNEPALSLKAVTTMIDWETIGLLLEYDGDGGGYLSHGSIRMVCGGSIQRSEGSIWSLVVTCVL